MEGGFCCQPPAAFSHCRLNAIPEVLFRATRELGECPVAGNRAPAASAALPALLLVARRPVPGAGARSLDGHARCPQPGPGSRSPAEPSLRERQPASDAWPPVAAGTGGCAAPRAHAREDGPGASGPGGGGRRGRRVRSLPTPVPSAREAAGEAEGRGSHLAGLVVTAFPSAQNLPASAQPGAFPEAPAASATQGGAGAGTASDWRGPGARARRRAGGAPRAGSSPLEQLAAGQRYWQEGGREPRGRRAGESKRRRRREGQRPLSRTYQSPRRSNVPAVHPGGGCTSPQRSRCSISLTSAAERCSRLSAPLAWNSAQPLQLPPSAAAWTRSSEIRMAPGRYHIRREPKTTGWKLWTSERAASPLSWTPSGRAASHN